MKCLPESLKYLPESMKCLPESMDPPIWELGGGDPLREGVYPISIPLAKHAYPLDSGNGSRKA